MVNDYVDLDMKYHLLVSSYVCTTGCKSLERNDKTAEKVITEADYEHVYLQLVPK